MPEPRAIFQEFGLLPLLTQATPVICQLAQEFSRAAGVEPALGQTLLWMLSPLGSAQGFAVPHPSRPSVLLLPSVLKTVLELQEDLRAALGLTPEAAIRFGQVLTRLLLAKARETPWAPVLAPAGFGGGAALSLENPILYAHWHIGHSAVAEHLAVVTQQAVVARLDQVGSLEAEARAHYLLAFLRVPVRVASQLKATDLAPAEGYETPLDRLHLGWKAIRQFDNYAALKASTRQTYDDNWKAFVLASPAGRKFTLRASRQLGPDPTGAGGTRLRNAHPSRQYAWPGRRPRASAPAPMAYPEDKEFAEQPEVRAFEAEAKAAAEERAQTLRPFTGTAGRGRRKDGRVPEMVAHPSARSIGVWTPRLIALQLEALGDEFSDSIVYWRQRVLLNLHIHTGLPSAAIETLAVARREPARLEEWAYMPEEGHLCVRPRRFLGRPPDLQPEYIAGDDAPGPDRRGGHRPVSDCLSLRLPAWLVEELNHYLHLLERSGGGEPAGRDDSLPLFWPPSLAMRPDFGLPFHEVLAGLHHRVSARIPGLVAFSAGQAALTFEGLYASAGLDPVFRYYVNHRKYRHLLLPLWYTCVSADELAARYEQASWAVWSEIQQEWRHLRGSAGVPMPGEHSQVLRQPASEVWYGNFHCPETDVLRRVTAEAQRAGRPPVWRAEGLTEEELSHNRRMEEAALRVLLLTGLRPFELKRLTVATLDEIDQSLAVEGKAHRLGAMGRVLPMSPGLSLEEGEHAADRKRRPFEIYDQPGYRCAIETGHLQTLVDELARAAGQPRFDVYGLRVLYRSELLSLGIAFDIANYLMGHQSAGSELFNLRLENRWADVVAAARLAAARLSAKYGWAAHAHSPGV